MISLRGVTLAYESDAETVTALKDVDLDVSRGQLLTVFGTSGSGKTTLLNVIAGLVRADSGTIRVGEEEVGSLSEAARATMRLTEVGVVFQDHNLIPEFSALENVELPLRARSVSGRSASDEAERVLDLVGLSGLGRRKPAQLSGGQKQRVGIARALVGGRQVLLADEPTGSLDSENSELIFKLLRRLADDGIAVIVATHDPLAAQVADVIVRMRDGKIVDADGVVTA